ncbi:MAG: hypothetical protein MR405_00085 [Mollicutes bacterium]|uniref:hypothetical protein n=1 Tax=Methanobrevibacter boviskoreani TaxID=1348249 RepID=UPI0023A8B4D8|nr:hypothetical protein [Methanobrevibacter boviskoreani]MCI5542309.1 hypothetical protein [Mollicutes bacterium]MDY2725129.1 hypothetical protein [Candidatus Onthovivens sp.]MCI6930984.1 hypothetical protein [Methanobrevibacter boviskoreani]MCI7040233.1 hypothetical protein [Mollicutes bacterium]MCI7633255.1 hypothetical protein [Mollicutes bacterium]
MAKVQVKYLTKPTNEIIDHINKFNKTINEDDVRDFLKENDNFCLIIYVFNKLDSLIFLKNSEETHEILVSSLYMNEYSTFKECVNFLINKFSNYKVVIDSTFKDKNFINVVKKNGGVLKNNRYIIQL